MLSVGMGVFHTFACFLLIWVTCVTARIHVSSATQFWQKNLKAELPTALQNAESSLSGEALNSYVRQLKNGHIASLSAFCSTAHLFCSPIYDEKISCSISLSYSYKCNRKEELETKGPHTFFRESSLLEAGFVDVKNLTDNETARSFLPNALANALPPFSKNGVPKLMKLFPFLQESMINSAVETCEGGTCVSSLEGLVLLGRPYSELYYQANPVNPLAKAKIASVSAVQQNGKDLLACHSVMGFPYKVVFCHTFGSQETRMYKVSVVGNDQLLAVCHLNTSTWNPSHVAFQELKTSPGKTEACHFIPQNHMVWY